MTAVSKPDVASFLLLLLCCTLGCQGQSPGCVFPKFMTAHQHWESHISMERRMTDHYIEFNPSMMSTRDYSTDGDTVTTRECLQQIGSDRLLVKVTSGENVFGYQCLEFIKRSSNVAQIMESRIDTERSEQLCQTSQMTLNPWLLVWPFMESGEEYVPCSITGGFDMTIYDNEREEDLCEGSNPKARWESDCQGGEGTHVDFRFFDCQGSLSMDTKQDLYCLGTWTEGQLQFSVMSDNDDLWPKLWLLRHRVHDPLAPSLEASLLSDIAADTAETISLTTRVHTLSMTRQVFASLCENEADSCDSCENSLEFCQKSCHVCDAEKQTQRCQFYQVTRGEWLDIGMTSVTDVRVATSMLYVDNLLPFQCLQLYTDQWFQGTGRRALVTVFKNGCKPRYNCVEMLKRGWNILEYRLSQGIVWPHTEDLMAEDVCAERNFKDDPKPVGNRYRNVQKKYLVSKPQRNKQRTPMNCGVSGRLNMKITYRDAGNCTGTLNLCETNSIHLSLKGCEGVPQRQAFICVGTMVSEGDTYVMTENRDDPDDVECWLFHQTEWMGSPQLVLTRPSECNSDTATNVFYRNTPNYIAKVDFDREEINIREEKCVEGPETTSKRVPTTTSDTTTTSSPTTTTTTTTQDTTTTTEPTTTTTTTETPTTTTTTTETPTTTTTTSEPPTTTTAETTTTPESTTTTTTEPPTESTTTQATTTSPSGSSTTSERKIVVNAQPRSGVDSVAKTGRLFSVMVVLMALVAIM